MGKTVTAYFAFSDEHRAAVREELQAAAGTEQRISVAEVAKGLGQKWQALDDAEKERCGGKRLVHYRRTDVAVPPSFQS